MAHSSDRIPSSRQDNSLHTLTKKFFAYLKTTLPQPINTNDLASYLCVSKRRVYDITNILEGLGYLKKRSVNSLEWTGGDISKFLSDDLEEQKENELSNQYDSYDHNNNYDSNYSNNYDNSYNNYNSSYNNSGKNYQTYSNENLNKSQNQYHYGTNRYNSDYKNYDSYNNRNNPDYGDNYSNNSYNNKSNYSDSTIDQRYVKKSNTQKEQNDPTKTAEYKELEKQESLLDNELNDYNLSLQCILQEEQSLKNAFINNTDLLNIPSLSDKLIFVVKAPNDTFLENKDTLNEYVIEMNVNSEKIDVFYISDEV